VRKVSASGKQFPFQDSTQRCQPDALRRFRLPSVSLISCSLILVVCVSLAGCGKRRPPLPPLENVPQRTELLSGVQRGNQVILSWPALLRNAASSSVQSIRRIDIYRLAEKPTAPLPLTEEEFATRSTLIGSIPYETISAADQTINYIDTLELAGEPTRLRYALRYVNAAGQRAAFSNFLLIEPAAKIAEPPVLLDREVSEGGITLRWKAPATNIDGSTPVNLLGYNLYRIEQSQNEISQTPLNTSLISSTNYVDKNFRFGEKYTYIVRSVSLGTGGAQVESLNSNALAAEPSDVFAPSPPADIRINAAPGRISIFFPANPERDIAGYNIYRSVDPDLPKENWIKLNDAPLTRTTFQDETIESGKKYYYYLRAIDTAGNTSAPSEVVSDTVP
jgi:fibronectin type 3 domain-containing protein/predicted small lipoprotein YifL